VSDNLLAVGTATTERKTAAQRREEILEAATHEFAERGLHGTSTDDIARRAGISQPYLFRLFGTKRELFVAVVERCFAETLQTFQLAVGRAESEDVLEEIGSAYAPLLASDPRKLLIQLHAYTASQDEVVREAVRRGFGDLYKYVARVSGASDDELRRFFAFGMLINVLAAIDLTSVKEPWAEALVGSCLNPE
jgi:AcrR family transcriptional regulator